ncbi:GDSL-type esterase/lipase family protein [Streptomyces sp. NPDC057193]|uniref:GDSL-type esterase/lipase family protein n=1 Tax=Streptomyces sp. NPDC057193 TaxID=3346043 RepID=UPI00363F987A
MFRRYRIPTARLALVSAVVLLSVSPPSASGSGAEPVEDGVHVITGLRGHQALDAAGGSTAEDADLAQRPLHKGAGQQWSLISTGDGAFRVVSVHSGLCLDTDGTADAGTPLRLNPCTAEPRQRWRITPDPDGGHRIGNVAAGTDVASDGTGTPVLQSPAHHRGDRRWRLTALPRVGAWANGVVGKGRSFSAQTVRMVVHAEATGTAPRIKLSNRYGAAPLTIGRVDVAFQSSGPSAVAGSHRTATFGGATGTTLAAGAELRTDPLPMPVTAGQNLLVSVYLPATTGPSTWHALAFDTTYISRTGDHSADDSGADYTSSDSSWYFLSGVDLVSTTAAGTIVAFGDSITDGSSSPRGRNQRWPNLLAETLRGEQGERAPGVVNLGIGGNRVVTDSPATVQGVSGVTRFTADALDQPGVTAVILLEGINDIGNDAGPDGAPLTARHLIDGYRAIVTAAHAKGVKVFGATLLPYRGAAYYTTAGEAVRRQVNDWIRTPGNLDGHFDTAAALAAETDPTTLAGAYDSGDHLHPNAAGMRAIADTVDLDAVSR